MAEPQITKEGLRALASLAGLKLSEQRLEELLPQVQRTAEAIAGLDALGLDEVEPAVVFKPERG